MNDHPNYTIRKAERTDMEQIIAMCGRHAEHENAQYDPTGKAERLAEHLFGENPPLQSFIVEQNESAMGYVTFMPQFSTWQAEHYLYLDCLYLEPELRGQGVGQAVMNAIRKHAENNQYAHVEWQTPKDNDDAIGFYNQLGATSTDKKRFVWKCTADE